MQTEKKYKIIVAIVLIFGLALVAIPALFLLMPFFHGISIPLLDPKGIIALKERNLLITALLIILIGVAPVYFFLFFFARKYRADKRGEIYSPDLHSTALSASLLWIFPAAIIFGLAILNWNSTHALDPTKQIASDKKPITIEVVALQWKWLFIYPEQNIATINFIEFPENTPLSFKLTADAPMSSFWIPQLGSQIYAMAGMQTQLNLIANEPGEFKGMDTEINGDGFSGMKFIAKSTSQSDFDQWVASVKSSPSELNLNIYNQLAEPSQNNSLAYYGSVDRGLYDTIMMKNMMPMTKAQMEQMSSSGMNMNASSTMDMEGMDMK